MKYGAWEAIDWDVDWEDVARKDFADLGANFLSGYLLAGNWRGERIRTKA